MKPAAAVEVLSALAQPSRLAVFRHLVECEPEGAYPGDIAGELAIPANTLSFHLKALLHAGLISADQQGRFIRYRASLGQVRTLVAFLTDNCCGGDPARCAPSASPARKSR